MSRRTVRCCCVVVACALPCAVRAQGSMTIYGILDGGLSYANHSATSDGHAALLKYGDSVASASRLGLRGSEQLAHGASAIFTLENGMNVGTGAAAQGGALFGRQAFVGLAQPRIGQLTFGRQYVYSYDYLGHYFATGGITAGAGYSWHINSLDQLNGGELNNAVKFSSADFHGLRFGAMAGFSNQAGAFGGAPAAAHGAGGSSRGYSFGALYRSGPVSAGFAWSLYAYPGSATPAIPVSLANVNPGPLKTLRTLGAGASYRARGSTVYALWTDTTLTPLPSSGARASRLDIYEAGVKTFVSTFVVAALGATFSDLSGGVEGRWKQLNGSVDYYVSKTVDVYALVDYQLAAGRNRGVPVEAQLGNSSSYFGNSGAGADTQLGLRVGVRVLF